MTYDYCNCIGIDNCYSDNNNDEISNASHDYICPYNL